jgi:hypothetical protein
MSPELDPQLLEAPSKRQLLQAIAIAALAAAAILVAAVLPAEYGIDPLGTGRAMGLTALSAPLVASEDVAAPAGTAPVPTPDGAVTHYPVEYKFDSRSFVLGPYEYVEYKYRLEKGATMLFSWTATADVVHDLHGDADGAPKGSSESFDKRPRRRANGSFTAPFTGIHGWFWENPGGQTITVKVTSAGFYTSALEFHFDGTRQRRDVRTLDTIASTDQ